LNKLGDDLSLYSAETFKKRAELFYRSGIALDTALSLAHRSLEIAHTYPVGLIRYFPETGHIPAFVDEITREKTTNKARGNLNTLIGLIKLKQGMPAESYITEGLQVSQDNETLANAGEYYSLTRAHQQAFDVYKKITMAVPEDTASFSKMQSAYAAWKPGLEGWEEQVSVLKTFWMEETLKQIRKEIINIATPDFASALVNLKGEPVNRESLRNKIIVLDFWATWCIPCMHEMPYLQNVYDQYKNDPDVVFMVINSGSKNTIDDARGWWGNKKFTFPVYFNNDPMIGEKLKFNVIPATYIIDKTGNIRFKTIGFEGAVIERKMKAAIQLLKEGEM
ncbi:MAG: TlpA family protein disulfide reductase, partial [Flavisolibacter sp.]|nr:TlpA family protein disulfide reductase [Flavisolibacter sp.]